jgi:hypothetical protein
MNYLEAKKKALVAESEVYRETLKLELQNLRIYGITTKRRLSSFSRPGHWMMLLMPLVGAFFKKRQGPLLRRAVTALINWQLWSRLVPFVSGLFAPGGTQKKATRRPDRSAETSKR